MAAASVLVEPDLVNFEFCHHLGKRPQAIVQEAIGLPRDPLLRIYA